MKQKITMLVTAFAMVVGIGVMSTAPAGAIKVFEDCPTGSTSSVCAAKDETVNTPVQTLISTLLMAIGIISVIMIIIGGIRYTLSNGDSSQITSAKNTILYAVIGLVVALLAYAIVNFVVGQF
jgi:hypothetical protein